MSYILESFQQIVENDSQRLDILYSLTVLSRVIFRVLYPYPSVIDNEEKEGPHTPYPS